MKHLLAIMLCMAVLASCMVIPAAAADNDPFEGKDEVTVVYLGGSITYGAGVPYEERETSTWRAKISKYFDEKFPDKTFHHINAGLSGTGTDMGIMRLERDVLSKNPDYVFIEFAVNDIGKAQASRHMESIVRSLQELPDVPYITFVYTARYNSGTQSLQNNSEAHEKVAKYYGIPSIDMKDDLEDAILETGSMEDQNNVKQWLVDLTHPTAAGYGVYTDAIKKALETGGYYVRPQVREEKLDINAAPLITRWIAAKDVTKTGTWTENNNASYGCGLTSSTVGDTLEFTFRGPVFGLQHRIDREGGKYKLYIDGRDLGTVDTYYATTSQGVLGHQEFALGAGEHRVKIEVVEGKNDNIADGTETSVAFDWFICQKNPSAYRWINEDYEDGDFQNLVPSTNMTYDWETEDTAGGSKGAMKVSVTGAGAGPSYRCETVAGKTYNVSAWIKVANIDEWTLQDNSDRVLIFFQQKIVNDDGSWQSGECYTQVTISDAGIISGDWVKVTGQYTCDGTGRVAGQTSPAKASDVARVQIRLGTGTPETTTGSKDVPITYYIDDLRVEPENIEPEVDEDPGNIVKKGGFNSEEDMSAWRTDGKSEIEYAEGEGIDGSGAALITGTDSGQNSVGIRQESLPIRINRAYKVSYWVKAANDAALGAFPMMIVEYSGKQTDPAEKATDYYPNYDMGTTYTSRVGLTDEWQKIEYIYKKDGVTNDICLYPKIYTRLYGSESGAGVWSADYPAYYVDDIRFDELPVVYDGDFGVNPAAQVTNATAKYKYPWGKYNNDQSGITWMDEAGSDGENGYLEVTQTNTTELMTYVDLEEGETYTITLDAKLDDWATEETSELKDTGLYITAIFNRARGDLTGETYTQQYQYVPTSSTGETDITRWILSDDWQTYEAEFTVTEQTTAKYRSPYVSFRLGTGKETATYLIDNVKIEKKSSGASAVPQLSNLYVYPGQPSVGTAVTADVDYVCSSDSAAYMFTVYAGTNDSDFVQKISKELTSPEQFSYTPTDADKGKNFKIEVRAVAKNGNVSNIVTFVTGVVGENTSVEYETAATAEFTNTGWGTQLNGKCELTADKDGAEFICLLAVYDEDNVLIGVTKEDKTLSGNKKDTVTMNAAVPRGAASAKLMVWDNECKPYCVAAEIADE